MDRDHIARFTKPIRLDPSEAALIVIDMQYASASRTAGLGLMLEREGTPSLGAQRFAAIERIVPQIRSLLAAFRQRRLPIVHVAFGSARADFVDLPERLRSYAQATGNCLGQREHEILDDLKPEGDEVVLRKTTISAFTSTGIESLLRTMNRRQLVVAGVSTNSCVDTTARDAADRGFECVLVSDACAATTIELHEAALATFQRLFGRVASAEAVLEELCSSDAAEARLQ